MCNALDVAPSGRTAACCPRPRCMPCDQLMSANRCFAGRGASLTDKVTYMLAQDARL